MGKLTDKIMNENGGKFHYKATNIINIILILFAIAVIVNNTINGGVLSLIVSVILCVILYGICGLILKSIDALIFKIRGH